MCMKKSTIAVCALACGLLLNMTAWGQSNFSGSWTMQNKEPIAGLDYDNSIPKEITFHLQKDSLIIESLNAGKDETTVSSRHAVAMNGQPVTSTSATSLRKLVKTLKWLNDKKAFELTTVYYRVDNPTVVDATRVEIWSLSTDDKQLNVHKKSTETQSDNWEVKGSYTKK